MKPFDDVQRRLYSYGTTYRHLWKGPFARFMLETIVNAVNLDVRYVSVTLGDTADSILRQSRNGPLPGLPPCSPWNRQHSGEP